MYMKQLLRPEVTTRCHRLLR